MKVAICRDNVSFSIAFHTARNAEAHEYDVTRFESVEDYVVAYCPENW